MADAVAGFYSALAVLTEEAVPAFRRHLDADERVLQTALRRRSAQPPPRTGRPSGAAPMPPIGVRARGDAGGEKKRA